MRILTLTMLLLFASWTGAFAQASCSDVDRWHATNYNIHEASLASDTQDIQKYCPKTPVNVPTDTFVQRLNSIVMLNAPSRCGVARWASEDDLRSATSEWGAISEACREWLVNGK